MYLHYLKRKTANYAALTVSLLSAVFGIFFLFWILKDVFVFGFKAINLDFFTELPAPPGMEGGGLANAIFGTVLITFIATAIGVPAGILAGTYLSEYGRKSRMASVVRFTSDILVSAPSIVIGVFVYALLVKPLGGFSAIAGAVALSIIMLPVVIRTAEEMLKLVPDATREAALALGAPHWKVTVQVVYRGAIRGIVTGVMLAVARVSGETAPLLFTSFNNSFWNFNLSEPTATLTVTIFNYAMGPYDDWHQKAWGAALLITAMVLLVTIFSRIIVRGKAG
ncbi:MAG TPA: phosphate ABC transporter permease PtsA [Deltaproteobacteria bacterium]|nr:MAG: phosphate ABC transporter, permease protein PstA [Deltaproteobacteria bacterium GWA2_55_82]OGQ62573.1 MAG: phosphate ABC transporter, permease protein PstA [Deltaproteobacteria bacterium RIFCSPLOWO2_02_FULL_55_12]OIJ74161.1 MAG: phosphate ABC transporter, permease protein PstA [Deltaproteobacteria bacterium GWC2_55_46]HBG46781.1 phosphate ABC transporter permease PtsA [Deltaproteobacteria bacterium]HCY11210.1 phosphate ABC transporter permease PtsA [Deltaproteobacteria bacterium]